MGHTTTVRSFDDVVAFLRQSTADLNRRNSERMRTDGVSEQVIAELCEQNDAVCAQTLATLARTFLDEPAPSYGLQ
jgi:hypothetical protein